MNHIASQQQQTEVATYTSASEDKFVDKRYANLRSDIVEITHDKLENVLIKFYQKHALRTAWFNPLSMVVGVALTLTTAEFKEKAIGLQGATWQAIFVIALVLSAVWLITNLARLAISWKETTLDFLIDRIKNKG